MRTKKSAMLLNNIHKKPIAIAISTALLRIQMIRNTKLMLITVFTFSLSTSSSLAAESTNAVLKVSPVTNSQQGANGLGYRSQGSTEYPQHKQFGSPPIQREKQPSQTQNNTTSDTLRGIPPDNQAAKKSPGIIAAEKRRALLHAAGFGDTATLKKLLEDGGNPNARAKNKTSRTALILATIGGKLETVNVLLSHGAKLDDRDFAGNTALNWAALRGHTQVASALLKKGANINTKNNAGASPLHYTVSIHNIPMVKLMIENGADLEVEASKYKVTPLQIAIEKKDIESLDILIKKGAKVYDKDREIIKKIRAMK